MSARDVPIALLAAEGFYAPESAAKIAPATVACLLGWTLSDTALRTSQRLSTRKKEPFPAEGNDAVEHAFDFWNGRSNLQLKRKGAG
jgi:hypothetical protein